MKEAEAAKSVPCADDETAEGERQVEGLPPFRIVSCRVLLKG
jgi:hypothetical protein